MTIKNSTTAFMREFLLYALVLFSFPALNDSLIFNSYNNHGVVGLINLPTARFFDESTGGSTFYYGTPDQKITISSSPYDWMEASFFYTNIDGKEYGSGFSQDYKDKGFNIKLKLKDEGILPSIAIGANDFAGTGFYSSEYLVASYGIDNFDFHFGLGWGNLNGTKSFKNPFIYLDDSFESRPSALKDQGGQVDVSQYFSGKTVSPFFGMAYAFNEKLIFKYERDSTLNPGKIGFEKFSSNNNFAVDYNINKNFTLGVSFERGNYTSLKLTYKKKANNKLKKLSNTYKKLDSKSESDNKYKTLIKSLDKNGIGVNKIFENDTSVGLELTQFKHPSIETLDKIVEAASIDSNIEKQVYKTYKIAGLKIYSEFNKEFEGKSQLIYKKNPSRKFNSKNSITLRPFIAGREGFLKLALLAENNSEFILADNLFFNSNVKVSIWDNFDDLYVPAKDIYLYQVRSDVKDYLNNFNNGPIIGRAQLDYYLTVKKNNHIMFTAGILEEMFSGIGFEHLYFNPKKSYAMGFDFFNVTKRDYKMLFGHRDYNVNTAFINLYYRNYNLIPFDAKISYGKYLGGDTGFTIDMYRSFENGTKLGVFATFTNVSSENFGEGSFDKGIYFNFPITSNFINYTWRPLTKDPGAKLNRKNTLHDLVVRFQPIN